MTVRRAGAVTGLALALLLPLLAVATSQAAAPVPWTEPQVVPGTAGLANPQSATAPDGTDVVLWAAGAVSPENVVRAKVRLPGRSAWVKVPVRLRGDYLGVTDIVGTADGDFWAVFSSGSSDSRSYIVRLDTRSPRWTKPTRLFVDQPDHRHAVPQIGLAGDGTLVVAASAPPTVPPPGDPVYRVAVTTKKPGGRWSSRFVNPIDTMALNHTLSVNRAGDILISFIQGYQLAETTVRVAAKAHGRGTPWKIDTLSVAGDSQRVRSSLAADGTAAVVWSAPSSTPTAVRLATRNVRDRLAPWVGRDVVPATPVDLDAYVLAGRRGTATTFWRTAEVNRPIWSRHFDGTSLASPTQVTPSGETAVLDSLVPRPDGKAFLLYQRFSAAPALSLGLEVRTLVDGVASDPVTLTGDETTFGSVNSPQLSIDGAGRGMLVYTLGDYPDTTFDWQAQLTRPAVMTGPATGVVARRAKVTGQARVGRSVTCTSGYWVEASSLSYRWTRDGKTIAGATTKRYDVRRADAGTGLACRVVGSNSDRQKTVLTSKPKVVGR